MDSVVQVDHEEKMKESEKIDKYLDFDRRLKKLEHEKNGDIPIEFGSLEIIPKDLGKKQGK